jgi:hypothetical protein
VKPFVLIVVPVRRRAPSGWGDFGEQRKQAAGLAAIQVEMKFLAEGAENSDVRSAGKKGFHLS